MVLDPALRDEWQEASRRYVMAAAALEALRDTADDTPDGTLQKAEERAKTAEDRMRDVQERAEAAGVLLRLVFRPVSPSALEEMKRQHPPTRKGEQWDEGFEVELIATCLVDPAMTVDDVADMRTSGDWSTGEYNQMLGAALTICQATTSVRLPGKG